MTAKHRADLERNKFNAQGEVKVAGDFAVGGQTEYSATDITALGSSTDMSDWLGAYHDGMLIYKYVEQYEGSNEKIVYYTHPDLGDNNKCLRFFYIYTTKNSVEVVESVTTTVADWTFDSTVKGSLTLTLGTITSPGATSSAGTDVCTVSHTTSGEQGERTITLSGTDASNYQLNNLSSGQTGSTINSVIPSDNVVVETAIDFTGSYNHSFTVTIEERNFLLSDSENVTTSA